MKNILIIGSLNMDFVVNMDRLPLVGQTVFAPESAAYLNPYREWIGAQIRGDFYGYVNPGNPLEAAKMAYRDGAVSHIKNGIYGEMYVAALISLTAVSKDMLWNCSEALKQIPPKSRIAEDINIILSKYREKQSYRQY